MRLVYSTIDVGYCKLWAGTSTSFAIYSEVEFLKLGSNVIALYLIS
jgi:hypothetical protein